jgi:hypothetical protein
VFFFSPLPAYWLKPTVYWLCPAAYWLSVLHLSKVCHFYTVNSKYYLNNLKKIKMNRIVTAVMHCTIFQPKKVITVGIRVRDLLFVNVLLYATPPITLILFKAQLDKAIAAQAVVEDGTGSVAQTATRDSEVLALFLMLNPLLITYVIGLYKGDKVKLLASGFEVSSDPNPKPAPSVPVITKVLMTDLALHKAKVYLAKFPALLTGSRGVVNYIVQVAEGAPTEENFKTVLTTTSSRKLVIPDLTRGTEIHIRICASNARGTSAWSSVADFMPA